MTDISKYKSVAIKIDVYNKANMAEKVYVYGFLFILFN